MQLVRIVGGQQEGTGAEDFADCEGVWGGGVEEGTVAPEPGVRLHGALLLLALLDQVLDRVQPETVGPHLVQPEGADPLCLGGDGRVTVVQVRHALLENPVVVLLADR